MISLHTGEDLRPVLWIDLDGTVRHGFDELGRFVNTADDVVIFDGVPAILQEYRKAGWRIVGVSNQGGIALGHLSKDDLQRNMERTHELCGKAFDLISVCMHHPKATNIEMSQCWCRKPRIGLIVDAGLTLSRRHREIYPPALGVFVGDRPEDAECAKNAGLHFMQASVWRESGWRALLDVVGAATRKAAAACAEWEEAAGKR